MKQSDALKQLRTFDQKGRYVYTARDLAKVFSEDSWRALRATVQRLTAEGILERPVKGV